MLVAIQVGSVVGTKTRFLALQKQQQHQEELSLLPSLSPLGRTTNRTNNSNQTKASIVVQKFSKVFALGGDEDDSLVAPTAETDRWEENKTVNPYRPPANTTSQDPSEN